MIAREEFREETENQSNRTHEQLINDTYMKQQKRQKENTLAAFADDYEDDLYNYDSDWVEVSLYLITVIIGIGLYSIICISIY